MVECFAVRSFVLSPFLQLYVVRVDVAYSVLPTLGLRLPDIFDITMFMFIICIFTPAIITIDRKYAAVGSPQLATGRLSLELRHV